MFLKKEISVTENFNCKENQDIRESKGSAWICECMVTRW